MFVTIERVQAKPIQFRSFLVECDRFSVFQVSQFGLTWSLALPSRLPPSLVLTSGFHKPDPKTLSKVVVRPRATLGTVNVTLALSACLTARFCVRYTVTVKSVSRLTSKFVFCEQTLGQNLTIK